MPRFADQRTNSPGYRIGRLYRLGATLLARRLKDLPISGGQIPLLMEVLHIDGLTQCQLSERVGIDPACTARALANLEEAGLVERVERPRCRRDKQVFATERAEVLLGRLLPILAEHSATLLEGFSEAEAAQALGYLDRMIANEERALADDAAQPPDKDQG